MRCLRKNGERSIRLIGADMDCMAGGRDLSDEFYVVPQALNPGFVPVLLDLCLDEAVDVVLSPVTKELQVLAENRLIFERHGIKLSVMAPETIRLANSKSQLLLRLRECGIATPAFFVFNSLDDFRVGCRELGYPNRPVVVKQSCGNGSRGVRILDPSVSTEHLFFHEKPSTLFSDYQSVYRTLSELSSLPEMLVMEYLPGAEYTVDAYRDQQVYFSGCRRSLAMTASIQTKCWVEPSNPVLDYCRHIADTLDLTGNFGFDLRSDENGIPLILEVNPRLTAGVGSFAPAGLNLPYIGVKRLLGESVDFRQELRETVMIRRYEEVYYSADGSIVQW